jgi:hypothetical protein
MAINFNAHGNQNSQAGKLGGSQNAKQNIQQNQGINFEGQGNSALNLLAKLNSGGLQGNALRNDAFNPSQPGQLNVNTGNLMSRGGIFSQLADQNIQQNQFMSFNKGNGPITIIEGGYPPPPPPAPVPVPVPVPPPPVPIPVPVPVPVPVPTPVPTPPPPPTPITPTPTPPPPPTECFEWPCVDQHGNTVLNYTSYDRHTAFVNDQQGNKMYFDMNQFQQLQDRLYGGYYPPGGQAEIVGLIQSGQLSQIPCGPDGLPILNRPPEAAIEGVDYTFA